MYKIYEFLIQNGLVLVFIIMFFFGRKEKEKYFTLEKKGIWNGFLKR